MKKCTKCEKKVTASDNFCPDCGAPCEQTHPKGCKCNQCLGTCATAVPVPEGAKSRLVAGLLGIFLGGIGVHRFYLGYTGIGIAQIIVTIITCGIGSLWGFIEGILILTGNGVKVDAKGNPLTE